MSDQVMWFIAGLASGVLISLVILKRLVSAASQECRRSELERERNDPANWWKYGQDPPWRSSEEDNDGGVV